MINLKYSAILICTFHFMMAHAQSNDLSLISAGGGMEVNESIFLSYSIGEPLIAYTNNESYWITEGFQQPGRINITSIGNISSAQSEFRFFPNPVSSELQIESTDQSTWELVQITNALGQPLLAKSIFAERSLTLDLNHLIPGIYLIHLLDQKSNPIIQSIIKI